MFSHILLCALLYAMLTIARAPNIWGIGKAKDGSNPFENIQTKICANLSNQFEWPLFFYIICLLLIISENAINHHYTILAWCFIVGRIAHSYIQIFTANIRLRGIVFTINFLAVFLMWILFVIENITL